MPGVERCTEHVSCGGFEDRTSIVSFMLEGLCELDFIQNGLGGARRWTFGDGWWVNALSQGGCSGWSTNKKNGGTAENTTPD